MALQVLLPEPVRKELKALSKLRTVKPNVTAVEDYN